MPVTGTVGEMVFEMKDVLRWLQEEAEAKGEIGWTDNFPNKDEFFAQYIASPIHLSCDSAFPGESDAEYKDWLRAHRRDENIQKQEKASRQHIMTMETMKPLMVHTEREVNRRLIKLGLSKREIAGKSLCEKVVSLSHLANPQVKNYVRACVDASQTTGNQEMFQVKLPIEESLYEVCRILKTAVDIHVAGSGTKQEKGALWRYQLLSHDFKRAIRKTSVYLKTDGDYQELVRIVKGNEKGTPVAVLTQEISRDVDRTTQNACTECLDDADIVRNGALGGEKGKESKLPNEDVVWDDSKWEMPLDDDGEPFFDPYDPKKISKIAVKFLEKNLSIQDRTTEEELPFRLMSDG